MTRLTFNNIHNYLQSKGIRCTLNPHGIKVYTDYCYLGSFWAVHGQCIFKGSASIEFQNTQYRMHELLDLFECDTVAITEGNSIKYICKIKAINPVQE